MDKRQQAAAALHEGAFTHFMSRLQRKALLSLLNGEEGDYFADKVLEYADRIIKMPKTYEQDGKGDEAVVHLHYFVGSVDAWITEKDVGSGDPEDCEQMQAFGFVNLEGRGGIGAAEMGYVCIAELIQCGAELDLHWEPKSIKDLK